MDSRQGSENGAAPLYDYCVVAPWSARNSREIDSDAPSAGKVSVEVCWESAARRGSVGFVDIEHQDGGEPRRPGREIRERLRGEWLRVAAQRELASRSLRRLATLRSVTGSSAPECPAVERDEAVTEARNTAHGRVTRRSRGGESHAALARLRAGSAPRRSRAAGSPSLEAIVGNLRGPLLRLAAAGGGRAPRGVAPASGETRGRRLLTGGRSSALARALNSLALAASTRAAHPAPADGAWTLARDDAEWPEIDADDAPGPREMAQPAAGDADLREVIAAQQELSAAIERLERRPAQWTH